MMIKARALAGRTVATRSLSTTATFTPKTALLLMNMGGPSTPQGVGPFLHNLFSDSDLIPLPAQSLLAPWIARRRTPSIVEQYAQIGGASPIRDWTERQGAALSKLLDQQSPKSGPHKSYIAFRYAPPMTQEALLDMKRDGIDRAVILSLYPQYSCSTTGSSLNELYANIQSLGLSDQIQWSVIDRWPIHPGLIEAFASHIETSLKDYDPKDRNQVVLLFSAHSLPMSVVNRGDPYPAEVAATVQAVMKRLGYSNPYRLVWQSQVGPSAWLGPKTNDAIIGYAKQGVKHLLTVPIAFVSDHIETLFELDLEYGELAEKHNIGFKRVESLNADPIFIQAMADLVKSHLQQSSPSTTQLSLRCPSCTSSRCGVTKAYFCSQPAPVISA